MYSAPDSNVKFTNEQQRQLEMFSRQLSNLHAEITIAQKTIQSTKDENVALVRERKSLESQLSVFQDEIGKLIPQRDTLRISVAESSNALSEHKVSHNKLLKIHQTKEEELAAREKQIIEVETAQQKKQKDLFAKNATLSEDRIAITKAREAFAKACESVVWR